MTDLPRRFEFDCKPFGRGKLYVVDCDVTNERGKVEIKYSPNHVDPIRSYGEVFWVETEKELESLILNGYRIITQIFDNQIVNVDDLL